MIANPSRKMGYIALAIVCATWSTTYLAMKYGTNQLPPFLMVSIRQTIAGALMILGLKFFSAKTINIKLGWRDLLPGVLMMGLCNGLITTAVLYMPTGTVSTLVAIIPIWVLLLETNWIRINIKEDSLKIIGTLLGFAGVFLLVYPKGAMVMSTDFTKGVVLLLVGTFSWAIGLLLNRKVVERVHDTFKLTAHQLLAGGLFLLPISLISEDIQAAQFTIYNSSAILYLAIFGSVAGFAAYNYSLKHLKPLLVSTSSYITPVISIILGIFIEGEKISGMMMMAVALILLGTALVNLSKK
jgi:drug/metabolite transporter (DMT)-like permease